jgi:hypothetical protein
MWHKIGLEQTDCGDVDWIEIACGRVYDGMYFLFKKKTP